MNIVEAMKREFAAQSIAAAMPRMRSRKPGKQKAAGSKLARRAREGRVGLNNGLTFLQRYKPSTIKANIAAAKQARQ